MLIKKAIIFIAVMLLADCAYSAPYFADSIVSYSGGTGLDFTGGEHTPRALGTWDLVFVSMGETGYLTVGFDNLFVVDEVGNDIRVYTTGHSVSNEPAEVFASMDSINFSSLGYLNQYRTSTWVADGPSYDIYYQEFDLGEASLDSARYIRVVDLPGGFVSTDIDAISALNNAPIPEQDTIYYFGFGGLMLCLFGLKKVGVEGSWNSILG